MLLYWSSNFETLAVFACRHKIYIKTNLDQFVSLKSGIRINKIKIHSKLCLIFADMKKWISKKSEEFKNYKFAILYITKYYECVTNKPLFIDELFEKNIF